MDTSGAETVRHRPEWLARLEEKVFGENTDFITNDLHALTNTGNALLALELLEPRATLVMRQRLGVDGQIHTLRQIGDSIYVTPGRVRQIEEKALRCLRHPTRACILLSVPDYSGPTPERRVQHPLLRERCPGSRFETSGLEEEHEWHPVKRWLCPSCGKKIRGMGSRTVRLCAHTPK